MNKDNLINSKEILNDTLKLIRNYAPHISIDSDILADFEYRDGYLNDKTVRRAVITLRSRGCSWGEKGKGCTMCGHYVGMFRDHIPSNKELITQFDTIYKKIDFSKAPILCVYNGGNFLNPNEIPYEVQSFICNKVSENSEIKKFVIESRVEFCKKDWIKNLKKILKDKLFVIAVGLETKNDNIRNLAINKGLLLSEFEKAAEIIKSEALLRVYTMIKPPFLTESEMIEDAVATIKYLKKIEPEEIHFEPITIQEHTLLYYLWRQGVYRLPWLWSIIEILKRISPIHVYSSPFAHYPVPIANPHNCPNCNNRILNTILIDYNRYNNLEPALNEDCACKEAWHAQLAFKDSRTLEARMIDTLKSTKEFIHLSENNKTDLFSLQESHFGSPKNFER